VKSPALERVALLYIARRAHRRIDAVLDEEYAVLVDVQRLVPGCTCVGENGFERFFLRGVCWQLVR